MSEYDFKSAKKYIQMHADLIRSATLGMHEDWFWTAETIFENGRFSVDLDDAELTIGGISGSAWTTPVLEIEFKDSRQERKDCYTGEATTQKPEWFVLGCLSQPIQDEREREEPPLLIGSDK